jgi:hypothetical protein
MLAKTLGKVPFALLCLTVGGLLTTIGIAAYILDYAALNIAGFFYGIPLILAGLALKITELKPVPVTQPPSPEVSNLRAQQATSTQSQIWQDVTRYRYGQSAHLDSTLKALGLSPTEEERPELIGIYETTRAGAYTLVLEFDSPLIDFEVWQQKQEKMTQFFGPGVQVELSQPGDDQVDVAIVATPAA